MPDAVVDTTVLIAFGHLDRLDLLPALFDNVWVPAAVHREATGDARFAEVPRINTAVEADLLRLLEGEHAPDARLLGLGAGDAAVIAVAREIGAVACLDDQQARQAAMRLGLGVVGTVGLLIRARRLGLIAASLPLVLELRLAGFRLGSAELEAVTRADESPQPSQSG